MSTDVSFADIVNQSIVFRRDRPEEDIVLRLLDTPWVQRLRDVSQTANTRLVYMFCEHSRFGHSLGVAHLANQVMDRLNRSHGKQVNEYRAAVNAAALLHDIGHIAPGSHTAFKTWFPGQEDCHEEIAVKILRQDEAISSVLSSHSPDLLDTVASILREDTKLPPWTRELISGAGWNADRGNWCIVDSLLAGVSYGKYNIPALIDSIEITPDGHLALRENRLDAMMHFALSRHAMYRQVYHHRVLLAADTLNQAIADRARALLQKADKDTSLPFFADLAMQSVLRATSPSELLLDTIFEMRESWWKYHLMQWRNADDSILSDLSNRLLHRHLFKTVRVQPSDDTNALLEAAQQAVRDCGYDPEYYLHQVSTIYMHGGESGHGMRVRLDNGAVETIAEAEPLYDRLTTRMDDAARNWLVLPAEAKEKLGRSR